MKQPVVRGHPLHAMVSDFPIALKSYRPRSFTVAAGLRTDPAYIVDNVYAAVRAELGATFSFDARAFGQPVFKSEVVAVIQSVAGVIASNLTAFCYSEAAIQTVEDSLDAQPAAVSGGDAVGAELLTIDPIPAVLTVLA